MQMHVGFLGPTFSGRSKAIDPSRCINFFPELNANPEGKAILSLIGTLGTVLEVDTKDGGPLRGLYSVGDNLYIVSGNTAYQWNGATLSAIGTLNTVVGPVIMEDNGLLADGVGGNQLMIVDGTAGYIYDMSTGTWSIPSLPAVPSTLTYLDGYFIITNKDSMAHWCSALYDGTTWPGLAVGKAVMTAGNVVRAFIWNGSVLILKNESGEFWFDAAVPTSSGYPFRPTMGVTLNRGCIAPMSVADDVDFLFFLAEDGVAMMQGTSSVIVSTPAITHRIQKLTVKNDAIGFCYSEAAHAFYVLTFPTEGITLVYDRTTQMWHEWSTYDQLRDRRNPNRHLSNCYNNWGGRHMVGDYRNGKVYELSSEAFTDNGEAIISSRIAPVTHDRSSGGDLTFTRFYVDAEVGGIADPNAATPQASLSWSIDGGENWSNEYWAPLGNQGESKTRLVWRRVGWSYNMVYDLTISDPVKKILVDTYVDVGK